MYLRVIGIYLKKLKKTSVPINFLIPATKVFLMKMATYLSLVDQEI